MEGIGIFEQLFTTMKELLTEIAMHYGSATEQEKVHLDDQLASLKNMSDQYMEQWLDFEEKLSQFYAENNKEVYAPAKQVDKKLDKKAFIHKEAGFEKAQGFYKLYMFKHAVKELEELIKQQPDDVLARMYLAMGYLRLGEDGDAYPLFQMILPLTENNQLKAISYNAMGCIQVKKQNMQKAMEYFQLAYQSDPACLLEPASQIEIMTLSQQRLP
jgi:tetratricopeptide (TPR) repeat protein